MRVTICPSPGVGVGRGRTQLRDTPVSEAGIPAREVQARLELERRSRPEEPEVFPSLSLQVHLKSSCGPIT